jgi:hypothetical protein
MKSVDRSAMVAGITTNSDYIEQWRRDSRPIDAEGLAAATSALADELDAAFPLDELDHYVATGGWSPETHPTIRPADDRP